MIKHLSRKHRKAVEAYLMQDERLNATALCTIRDVGICNRYSVLRAADFYGSVIEGRLAGVIGLYNNSQCSIFITDERAYEESAHFICMNPSHTVFGDARSMDGVTACLGVDSGYKEPVTQFNLCLSGADKLCEVRESLVFNDVRSRRRNNIAELFISRCIKECFGFDTRPATVSKVIAERQGDEAYYIVMEGPRGIGQVHIQALTPAYAQIGGVAVLQEFRRQGYGQEIVSYISAKMLSLGYVPTLLVDESNAAARAMYEKLGFADPLGMRLMLR